MRVKESFPLAPTQMELKGIMLSEISQRADSETQILHGVTYLWSLNTTNTNKIKKHRKAPRYEEQIGGYHGLGGEDWVKWAKGVKQHKPPVIT